MLANTGVDQGELRFKSLDSRINTHRPENSLISGDIYSRKAVCKFYKKVAL
jgi:hypothetical protein